VPNTDDEIEARLTAFDGTEFIITRRRWLHIVDRHPELRGMMKSIIDTASAPDEVFLDPRGSLHLGKGLKDARTSFLVVIARRAGLKTYLITAYPTGRKRMERRSRKFKRLLPS
jgi:hypothetical protein